MSEHSTRHVSDLVHLLLMQRHEAKTLEQIMGLGSSYAKCLGDMVTLLCKKGGIGAMSSLNW